MIIIENTGFKQTTPYGCGLYALANLLQKETTITEKRLEESKNGNTIGQLNKWLKEDDFNYSIEPFYFNIFGKKLPKKICDIHIKSDDSFLPLLIDIQETKKSKQHIVCAELLPSGNLMVIDSLKEKIIITSLKEYNKDVYKIFGLWYLRAIPPEGDNYIMRHF
jgi:hypothetical protein